jgi:hypothetical protein
MFIHNKRNISLPTELVFEGTEIEIVSEFKLLGITLDNKLNFSYHVRNLRYSINKKLYSIQKLFHLPKSVKLQFFKNFVLPHFDYCLSLLIYFPKKTIQSLSNCFYTCLFTLFNFSGCVATTKDFNKINNDLEALGLNSFIHRLILKLATFFHKLFHDPNAPASFKQKIVFNKDLNKPYNLRNINQIYVPGSDKNNLYGDDTFSVFFSKFVNEICLNDINIDSILFKNRIRNNINIIFIKFNKLFQKFDVNFIENYILYRSS